ncbi:MAG: twin-arginine translocation pathway signal protein, partial [Pseudomonadota bacterium]
DTTLDDRPVARVTFRSAPEAQPDPLFRCVPDRRTNRAPFDQDQPVAEKTLESLRAAISPEMGAFDYASNAETVTMLKDVCVRAWRVEATTPRTHRESTEVMRIGAREINANPDGISLSGAMMEAGRLAGFLTREKLSDPSSNAFAQSLTFYEDLINSAVAFGWLSTNDNLRTTQLGAGAGWVRCHLAATRAGLAMQPLSQALQEFQEMDGLYKEVHTALGVEAPARIQGLFRFGYAKSPPPAPRWPLETRLLEA